MASRRALLLHPGSSPRMRGTPPHPLLDTNKLRFIPADAGNTGFFSPLIPSRAVHPRGCGEHLLDGDDVGPEHGSSPRMRGTRLTSGLPHFTHRFIPADAGNTAACRRGR